MLSFYFYTAIFIVYIHPSAASYVRLGQKSWILFKIISLKFLLNFHFPAPPIKLNEKWQNSHGVNVLHNTIKENWEWPYMESPCFLIWWSLPVNFYFVSRNSILSQNSPDHTSTKACPCFEPSSISHRYGG